jgi:hypothetical protein
MLTTLAKLALQVRTNDTGDACVTGVVDISQ